MLKFKVLWKQNAGVLLTSSLFFLRLLFLLPLKRNTQQINSQARKTRLLYTNAVLFGCAHCVYHKL